MIGYNYRHVWRDFLFLGVGLHLEYPVFGQDVFDGTIFGYKKSPVIAGDFLGTFYLLVQIFLM